VFDGVDVTALRGRDLRQWRARSAMIFQQFNLVGRLDVLTNVLMGRLSEIPLWRSLAQLWPEEDLAVAMSALEQFDMASMSAQRADQLSGGQQQRVAIARALASRPAIIFADEPTGNLDSRASAEVLGLLRRCVGEFGQTVVIVTHDPVAASYSERVVFLADGRVAGALDDPAPEAVLNRMRALGEPRPVSTAVWQNKG
jgi:phosphonate transport system ATP-binding protein